MAEICAEGNASASRGAKREHNRAGWRINALQQRLGNHIDRAETLFVGNHEVVVKHTALQQVIEQWEEHLMAERERESTMGLQSILENQGRAGKIDTEEGKPA